jgi:hypothetical protein
MDLIYNDISFLFQDILTLAKFFNIPLSHFNYDRVLHILSSKIYNNYSNKYYGNMNGDNFNKLKIISKCKNYFLTGIFVNNSLKFIRDIYSEKLSIEEKKEFINKNITSFKKRYF